MNLGKHKIRNHSTSYICTPSFVFPTWLRSSNNAFVKESETDVVEKKAFRFVMRSWSSPVTLETSSLVNGLIPCAYPQVMFEINGSFFTVKMHWMTTYKLCLWNALQITGHKANIWRYVLHRPYPLHCIGILSFRSWSLFARIGIKLKIASYVK